MVESGFKLLECLVFKNGGPETFSLEITTVGSIPPMIPPPAAPIVLVAVVPLIRHTEHDFGAKDAPQRGVSVNVEEGNNLIVHVDFTSGRKRLADGVGFNHRHPEKVHEEVIRRILSSRVTYVAVAYGIRAE